MTSRSDTYSMPPALKSYSLNPQTPEALTLNVVAAFIYVLSSVDCNTPPKPCSKYSGPIYLPKPKAQS